MQSQHGLIFAILFSFFLVSNLAGYSAEYSALNLINIKKLIPDVVISLPYATKENFTGKVLYQKNSAYLLKPAAEALASAAIELRKNGYQIKVYDAYRPLSVQKILWEQNPNPKFVAKPTTGSRHNRGASIDVTIVDKNLKEVEMPSGYDEFGPKASSKLDGLPENIKKNLILLQSAMEQNGFSTIKSEWWHFDHASYKEYPLLDVSLEELE